MKEKKGQRRLGLDTPIANAFRERFKKEIDYVLSATTNDPNDLEKRTIVARIMEAAIRFSKARASMVVQKTGKSYTPAVTSAAETDIVKYARLVNTLDNWDHFATRLRQVFPKFSVVACMVRFPLLDWRYKFELPDDVVEAILRASEGKPLSKPPKSTGEGGVLTVPAEPAKPGTKRRRQHLPGATQAEKKAITEKFRQEMTQFATVMKEQLGILVNRVDGLAARLSEMPKVEVSIKDEALKETIDKVSNLDEELTSAFSRIGELSRSVERLKKHQHVEGPDGQRKAVVVEEL